jgi:periplasmic mercuric ion binding protein
MKQLVMSIFCLLMASTVFAQGKTETVKIKTSAICEMCKERIERNLAFEKGVAESNLDVDSKVLTVSYNPKKTTVAKIKANVSKSGYDADELLADEKSYAKLPNCCQKTAEAHH